jgi:hypothetical protein
MPAQAPSNWLSRIIEENRGVIDRLVPFVEKKAERDAIVEAIKAHPQGGPLADSPYLLDVIWAALGVANDREREAKRSLHVVTVSPTIHASWFVFDELGLPLPEAEA